MIKHKSVGVIIFRDEKGARKYLILHYTAGHWDYPKGHVETDETEEQTLTRELEEETGITKIKLIAGFKEKISYRFKQDGKLIDKEVVFYLAETEQEDVKLSHEHKDFRWLRYEEAFKLATYNNAKQILEKAEKFLK